MNGDHRHGKLKDFFFDDSAFKKLKNR